MKQEAFAFLLWAVSLVVVFWYLVSFYKQTKIPWNYKSSNMDLSLHLYIVHHRFSENANAFKLYETSPKLYTHTYAHTHIEYIYIYTQ